MKQLHITFLLTLLMSLMVLSAYAHAIALNNADGVTIYYFYTGNSTELSVSYRGDDYYEYSDEYSGNVVIPEYVNYRGTTFTVTSIDNDAFRDCTGLTSVTIPNSVKTIDSNAFECCSGLTSVTIGNSVTSIGDDAFYGCSDLASIIIPNSVTFIGSEAFHNTAIYENAPDGVFYVDQWVCGYKGTKPTNTSILLEKGTRGIGSSAFSGCSGMTSIDIPSSVTSIGKFAFDRCSGLTSVIIPNSVTSIGYGVFQSCSGLTNITIPNSVTSIGGAAFADCSGLTSVTIPNSVTSIGGSVFYVCI